MQVGVVDFIRLYVPFSHRFVTVLQAIYLVLVTFLLGFLINKMYFVYNFVKRYSYYYFIDFLV